MNFDRRLILIALGALSAIAAYVVGYPTTAAGVVAGMPIGLINYQMMFTVRQRLVEGNNAAEQAGALMQRTMLRLLLSAGSLLLASLVSPEFLVGVLVGVVLEVLSYFGDAMRMFLGRAKK